MFERELDRAAKEKLGALTLVDTHFISGEGWDMTLGGQFKTFRFAGGIEFTVKNFSFFDDPVHCRAKHPLTLKPIDSYRCIILDIGRRSFGANLIKVVRKGRELVMRNVSGMLGNSGFGGDFSSQAANAKDSSSWHILSEYAYVLLDPRSSGEILPAVDPVY